MNRELNPGRFESPWRLLAATLKLFGARFGAIATIILLVYLPGHLLYQAAAAALEIPSSGILSLVLLDVLDLVLSSLAIPAIVHALTRSSKAGSALAWGRALWGRTLLYAFLADVTILLYGALLIVPGLVAMVRLAFVPVIVAMEAGESRPLARSRELARGRGWRIAGVLAPLAILEAAANFLLLGRVHAVDNSRVLFALAESGIAIAGQITTVATLLMYLGITQPPAPQRKIAKL